MYRYTLTIEYINVYVKGADVDTFGLYRVYSKA